MTDREKVIKGLECLARKQEPSANPCKGCGYNDKVNFAFCVVDVASDALELLEPVEPIEERLNEIDCIYRCWNCRTHFYYRQQKYCAICGRAVKWDATE